MELVWKEDALRLAKRLKRFLQDDLGEDTRLARCLDAVAEGLDFDDWQDLCRRAPAETRWNGEWCANRLADDGHVADPRKAVEAVRLMEAWAPPAIARRIGLADVGAAEA